MKTSTVLVLSAALATTGLLLLVTQPTAALHTRSAAAPPLPTLTAPTAGTRSPEPPASPHTAPAVATAGPATATPSITVLPTDVLAPDDGPAGDHLVQAMLDSRTQHNLPPQVEQHLDQLGRAVWLADLTGQGRNRWPRYFTSAGTSGYTHVRIQAASAHATGTGRAEVTLIWAGTSPAGDPEVALPGTVQLTEQPDGTWKPIR